VFASWFRLKYPHVALGAVASSPPILCSDDITPANSHGALASSAPILCFDDITPENGYVSIFTKDFRVNNKF
jgi:lysosomal Pro-X carboxypeptidase